ncbi:hypothetical protein [Agathobacter rectalis]
MERNEIKEANRKAMPGFLLLALVGAIVGGVLSDFIPQNMMLNSWQAV